MNKIFPFKFKLKCASVFPSATVLPHSEYGNLYIRCLSMKPWEMIRLAASSIVLLNQRSVSPATFTGVLTSRCNNQTCRTQTFDLWAVCSLCSFFSILFVLVDAYFSLSIFKQWNALNFENLSILAFY